MKNFKILLSLMSLIAPAFSASYWELVKMCPNGQYPGCTASSQQQYSTSTSSMSSTWAPPTCFKCPKGTATFGGTSYNAWYANNNYGCQTCWSGYANETGMSNCMPCPEGSQCLDPTITPKVCPKGFSSSSVWTDGDLYENKRGCKPCPENMYASKEGSIQCSFCPPGFFCPDPRSDPVPCPKGTATEINGASYLNNNNWELRCKQCPRGYYTNSTGSALCSICPPGHYCPDPTKAIKCPLGTYRNNLPYLTKFPRQIVYMQNDASFCIRCPQGYYANVEGSTSCIKCPQGSYCANPINRPSVCPPGTFSRLENGQQQCLPCPDGFYSVSNGTRMCIRCQDGFQCNDKKLFPKKCPLGTYSNSTMSKMYCAQCPPGTFANATGMTFCYKCPSSMCCDDPTLNPMPCLYQSTTTPIYTTIS